MVSFLVKRILRFAFLKMHFQFSFYLGTCCKTVEVYYATRNAAYDSQSKIFGSYTVSSEKVNGRYFYQSDYENGIDHNRYWKGKSMDSIVN